MPRTSGLSSGGKPKPAQRAGKSQFPGKRADSAAPGGEASWGANVPNVPRIIVDGIDLTPLPLRIPVRRNTQGLDAAPKPAATGALDEVADSDGDTADLVDEELLDDDYGSASQLDPDEDARESVLVTQTLRESATTTLLAIPGVCVAVDFARKPKVEERNAAYDTLVGGRAASDRYTARHAQTLNFAQKHAEVMASPPVTAECGCEASQWDIFDANEAQSKALAEETAGSKKQRAKAKLEVEMRKTLSVALASPDFLLDISEAQKTAAKTKKPHLVDDDAAQAHLSSTERVLQGQQAAAVLSSRALAASLSTMERCVQQNLFHAQQLRYRDHLSAAEVTQRADVLRLASDGDASVEDDGASRMSRASAASAAIEEDAAADEPSASPLPPPPGSTVAAAEAASLELLWSWSAPMTRGRTVTCMSWNRVNADVLAVGYGSLSYEAAPRGGLVLFWSLRNPTYPERVIELGSGCTALDFSTKTPHLLAVGMHDGTVAIYNVRAHGAADDGGAAAAPMLDSEHSAGKHMDPVWQVQWVGKGSERGESLVSISTDGRVVEWSMKKGLEDACLMVLKRVGASEGVISRQASGLCFDFARDDASIYLAGTEDGLVHRCSCSYNEQYLETYTGHTGPVYRIRYSPFWPPAFLSCSADWTAKLWHASDSSAVHTFQSVDLADVVHDVAWSPHDATVFALVAGDGRMEIWDLHNSTLDPAIRQFNAPDGAKPPDARPASSPPGSVRAGPPEERGPAAGKSRGCNATAFLRRVIDGSSRLRRSSTATTRLLRLLRAPARAYL
mmetsp:Transcript_13388/g.46618  ORF Transcript_13388/g.46618 Transcript_13388/m.46618 type:complete len:792 (-) Transcript_13388:319-2694(-)